MEVIFYLSTCIEAGRKSSLGFSVLARPECPGWLCIKCVLITMWTPKLIVIAMTRAVNRDLNGYYDLVSEGNCARLP